jgi:hypothetical protein
VVNPTTQASSIIIIIIIIIIVRSYRFYFHTELQGQDQTLCLRLWAVKSKIKELKQIILLLVKTKIMAFQGKIHNRSNISM